MQISRLHYPLSDAFKVSHQTVVAMGFFDGFHKGHQAVLQRAKDEAQKAWGATCGFDLRSSSGNCVPENVQSRKALFNVIGLQNAIAGRLWG